jgi:hypothetical protein
MQPTTTASQVYATVITNPGITMRELRKELPEANTRTIHVTVFNMTKRGALIGINEDGGRSTRYYKGPAPANLRLPNGLQQRTLGRTPAEAPAQDSSVAGLRQEVKQMIAGLNDILVRLEKI